MSPTLFSVDRSPVPEGLRDLVRAYLEHELALLQAASGLVYDAATLTAQTFDHLDAYLPPRGAIRVAADAAGAPVGCVFLKPVRADACEIKRLSVDPASRGLGLGRRLMTSALEEARRLGARCVLLDTGVYDKAAHNLYDKLGFRRIPRYPESENDAALEPYLIYMRREL